MSCKNSTGKDYRAEVKIQDLVRSQELEDKRITLPGSAPGWAGDLILAGRQLEVKARAKGFRRLYSWLEGHFGLVLSSDRCEPLIVLRLGDFLKHCQFRDTSQIAVPKTPSGDSGTGFGNGPEGESRHD